MTAGREGRRLLTATQIAAFCDVDLKTIHNWADRGKIPAFRTTGRHLRFRRLDVVDFLRAYSFAIPDALRESRPHVLAVDGDPGGLAWMQRALARRFEVAAFEHVVDALVALAAIDPDVALLGNVAPLEPTAIAARLRGAHATRHVRIVALGRPVAGVAGVTRIGGVTGDSGDPGDAGDAEPKRMAAPVAVPQGDGSGGAPVPPMSIVARGDTARLREVMERVTGLA
jgi:excisionase family DNA binding protein